MKKKQPKVKKLIPWKLAKKKANEGREVPLLCRARYEVILKEYIKENDIKFCGDKHQDQMNENFAGVPLFDTGDVFMCTMRGWGRIMSEVWGGAYMDYYMTGEDE